MNKLLTKALSLIKAKARILTPSIVQKSLAISLITFLSCATAANAQNAIVNENKLPGTSPAVWSIVGAGDLSIQGFATDISVNKGQTVRFKIKTAATNYKIDIYRIGYYQGNGARKVGTGVISATLPQYQPNFLYDAATGKVDCGNWNESGYYNVPTTAVSGIYLAKLIRTDNGGSSHIVFIVRDDAGTSNILFKTTDATWQAYNDYGGSNLYDTRTPIPGTTHATKVSYNRPFNTGAGGLGSAGTGAEDWFLNAEYPMIRWLERNGYDMSYVTDVDLDRSTTAITPANHKILMSVGHDEYWSAGTRKKFEDARGAGVHLTFFSGNEIYWKTRWEDNHRTLVCYKEGNLGELVCGGKCDPLSTVWTGLWRAGCQFPLIDGCQPENALSGQISWNLGTGAIKVPSEYKNLRFWRNTSIANLADGQTATLADGSLGFEFDWEQFEQSRPAGRITMSSTTLNSRTHKISLYKHNSGALVFGAGTVQWSWGLDGVHDRGTSVPDVRMQQATVNLLADMNAQPGSLQSGLVAATASTDTKAPVSVITSPLANANLKGPGTITITGTATDVGGVVAGVEVSIDGGTTWVSANGTTNWAITLPLDVLGTTVIKSRSFDDSGNIEDILNSSAANAIVVSANASICPCTVFQPTDVPTEVIASGKPVELGLKFRASKSGTIKAIRYYKGTVTAGSDTGHLWSSSGAMLAEASFKNIGTTGWQEVSFSTPVPVSAGVTYVASVFSASGDLVITRPFFTASLVNGPLTALADGLEGGNGVFKYSTESAFPTDTWVSTNYWVDVVFEELIAPSVACPCNIFKSTDVPTVPKYNDLKSLEVGVKFRTTQNGVIEGIQFYKGLGTIGIHEGNLWRTDGTLLSKATFVNEGLSGWQKVLFANPVAVTAGTTYIASIFSNSGDFAYSPNYFLQRAENGPLVALASGEAGGNGVYIYSNISAFPTQSGNNNNYWIDVIFNTTTVSSSSPVIKVQPVSQELCAGSNVTFNSTATGSPAPTVQWQVSTNAATWVNITGATASSLTFAANIADNGKQYRAVWTNSAGSINSSTAILKVNQVTASVFTTTNVSCVGGDGIITMTQTGGTAPYSYSLNGGTPQSSSTFSNLSEANYNVTVKDSKGCSSIVSGITITKAADLDVSVASSVNPSCASSNGSFTLLVTGGTPPYRLSKNGGQYYQSSTTFSNLSAGVYNILVKDAKNCNLTIPVSLNNQTTLNLALGKIVNANCNDEDGSITVVASGGTPPYSYTKNGSNFQSSATFNYLASETFSLAVKDAKNCIATLTNVVVGQEPPVKTTLVSKTNVSCQGKDGSFTISVTGGTAPYSYNVKGGSSNYAGGGVFTKLSNNTYTVTTTDAKGCTSVLSGITISNAPKLNLSLTGTTKPCSNINNGTITVDAAGGIPPYQYSLNGGSYKSSNTFTNLAPGNFYVTVSDAEDCNTTISGISLTRSSTPCSSSASAVGMNQVLEALSVASLPLPVTSDKAEMKVYPNPTRGEFNIQLSNIKVKKVMVMVVDEVGVLVTQKQVQVIVGQRQTVNFNLSDRAPGIYFIRVISDFSAILTNKVIVVK